MEELTSLKDDCEKVVSMMHSKRQNIFNRLEILDKEAGVRDQRRKEVMLREMKRVLALLTETEKNLVTEFKAEVMDKMALVSRLSETFRKLRDDISIAVMKEKIENVFKLNEDLETLKKQFDEVDLDFLEKCQTGSSIVAHNCLYLSSPSSAHAQEYRISTPACAQQYLAILDWTWG